MRDYVLITRPDEDVADIEKLVKQSGYEVVCESFLDIITYDKSLDNLEKYRGLIFTSRNGVRAFCHNSSNRFLSVWTVGDSTKDLALGLGFQDVQSAEGNLDDLEALLDDEVMPDESLLYVRGKHISRDLSRSGVREEVLYHSERKKEIPKDMQNMIKEGHVSQVLFFSVRTAEAFVKLVHEHELEQGLTQTKALCLGASMVESLSVLSWKSIEVATNPNRESLLALLG